MKHFTPLLVAVAIAIAIASPLAAWGQTRLLPVDEAAAVSDFLSFRSQLRAAVAKRDLKVILAAMSKNVKLSYGGSEGLSDFLIMWKPESPDTKLWEELAEVLDLGGTFDSQGAFTAPYVFSQWPREKDAFTHMAAIRTGVRVRTAPNARAPVIASLDFSVVETSEYDPATGWVKVKLSPGRAGYVHVRYLRSPLEHRIRFEKQEGKWQAVFFIAGD
jgi:hypothetical protein